MKRARSTGADPTPPAALDLRLADGTPGEAFERLARAVDERRVTIGEARQLADILERRLHVLDAERFAKRLELAEATAREAQRRALLPARRATVEVEASPPEESKP
jgi:hypothetical protein